MSLNPVFDLSNLPEITLADLESAETEPSLADLFAMADLIGSRYQTAKATPTPHKLPEWLDWDE